MLHYILDERGSKKKRNKKKGGKKLRKQIKYYQQNVFLFKMYSLYLLGWH